MSTAAVPSPGPAVPSAEPPFSHRLAIEAGVARLWFGGEIDLIAQPRLASALDRCTSEAARRKRAMGGRFVVVPGHGAVQRLFDRVGVTLDFEVAEDMPSQGAATDRHGRQW